MLLRRTKGSLIDGQPIVELPTREVRHARLEFPPAERTNYDQLQQRSMAELKVNSRAQEPTPGSICGTACRAGLVSADSSCLPPALCL